MNKITFKDLPSTETPINAENLNLMQENIENTIESKTLLWEGIASARDSITLNDDYTKYNFLHIVTGTETLDFGSALIASTISTGNEIDASKLYVNGNGQTQIHSARFFTTGNNKTLTLDNAIYQITSSANVASLKDPVACKVKKIYGTM